MTYQSVNPYTSKIVKTFDAQTDQELEHAIATAFACFADWRMRSFQHRSGRRWQS